MPGHGVTNFDCLSFIPAPLFPSQFIDNFCEMGDLLSIQYIADDKKSIPLEGFALLWGHGNHEQYYCAFLASERPLQRS